MPAGPSRPPGAIPPGLVGLGRLPEGEIARILLCPLTLRRAAALDGGRDRLLAACLQATSCLVVYNRVPLGEPAIGREARHAEIHIAPHGVGVVAGNQLL